MDNERWIYISPHFDDAVLSCGGLIYEQTRQGKEVEIWTICAGEAPVGEISPLAQVCHFQWGMANAEETVTKRRGEDHQAAGIVGAGCQHFPFPDCVYRRGADGELLYTMDVFGQRHPFEKDLDIEIAEALARKLQPGDRLVCPLTIGRHLDHVLTRAAVDRLGQRPWYYADIPYLLHHPEELDPATAVMESEFFPVSEAGLRSWQDGIAAYRSQILMLFETEEKMRTAIDSHWAESQGTHLWRENEAVKD